nr:MAG TPA: hypothetical protein [Caudoviricetes sp.]
MLPSVCYCFQSSILMSALTIHDIQHHVNNKFIIFICRVRAVFYESGYVVGESARLYIYFSFLFLPYLIYVTLWKQIVYKLLAKLYTT